MKSLIPVLCTLLVVSGPVQAETSPQAFLSAILQHDFDGVGGFRVGKVIYTDGRSATVGDECCNEPRELFVANYEAVELVTSWELTGSGVVTDREARLPVRFVVVGETPDLGGPTYNSTRLKPLAAARRIRVTYHLMRRDGDRVLVNPPIARVGLIPLIDLVRNDIQDFDLNVKRQVEQARSAHLDDGKILRFYTKINVPQTAQLAALERLALQMKLSLEPIGLQNH